MIAPEIGTDVGQRGQQCGDEAEQEDHRHAIGLQHEPGGNAFYCHAEQAAEQQPAQRRAHGLRRTLELVALVGRQDPREPAPIDVGLDREVDAQHQDQEQRGQAADEAADGTGDLPDAAHRLAHQALHVALVDVDAVATQPAQALVELPFDRCGQLRRLNGDLATREQDSPHQERQREQQDDSDPHAATERQDSAEQSCAPVDQRAEYDAAEDHQQRTRQENGEAERHRDAEPGRGPAYFQPGAGIGDIARAGASFVDRVQRVVLGRDIGAHAEG